jgi:hypothetical protein
LVGAIGQRGISSATYRQPICRGAISRAAKYRLALLAGAARQCGYRGAIGLEYRPVGGSFDSIGNRRAFGA